MTDRKELAKKLFRWETFLVVLLLLEIVVFGMLNPRFLRPRILFGSINDFMPICVISLFVTFVLVTGGMDIQAGSIVGLTSIIIGILFEYFHFNIWLACFSALLAAALCGMLSGFLVAYTKVQPMVVTLGGSFFYAGAAITITKMAEIETHKGISGFPPLFTAFTNWYIGPVPFQALIFIVLVIVSFFLLHRTKYGREVFLCGINQDAAEYSGINTRLVKMSTYALSGLGAGMVGIILTSYLGTAKADFGKELTLPIITAVVLGGTSILGGKGTIAGTVLATIVIGIMRFGLSMSGVNTQYLDIPVGILLVIAVGIRGVAGVVSRAKKTGIIPVVNRNEKEA